MNIQKNVSLQLYNTFGIEAKAQFFVQVANQNELIELQESIYWQELPKLILGGGSNILLTQDYPGLVIKNNIKGIQILTEDEQNVWLSVGSGENWHQFVLYCIEQQYAGIENLSLIPGTVGAAPVQNIGAYGVEIKEVFETLSAIHMENGQLSQFDREFCQFGYRDSVFKNQLKNQYFITAIQLKLKKHPEFSLDYGGIKETLAQMNIKTPSIKAVSDAVIKIRQQKLPDPRYIGNAGSFFKNPIIRTEEFLILQEKYSGIPSYFVDEKHYKVPAAWLIEQCGWKGKRIGNIGVHPQQPLVLVNYGQGKGLDIKNLAKEVQASVLEKFNVKLELEVNVI